MALSKVIIILLLFYTQYIFYCICAPCDTLNKDDCDNAAPRCVWKVDGKCYCGNNAPLDVMFVMDESGSMGGDHFEDERQFVADMIRYGLSEQSNVHIFKFGSVNNDVYDFWDTQQPKNTAIQSVLDTDYCNQWCNGWHCCPGWPYWDCNDYGYGGWCSGYFCCGGTYMSSALQKVKQEYTTWRGTQHLNCAVNNCNEALLVFLTDGRPTGSYSPCGEVENIQSIIGEENIIVVGMGQDWWKQDIQCMVQPGYPNSGNVDHSRILEVNQWSQSAFDAARHSADKFLCPEVIQLKLTEIRMELYDNSGQTHQSKFIEIYNYGSSSIDLSQETLKFNGFMVSDSFGKATSGSSCAISIQPKQYLVIYDNNSPFDIPECPNCNCTLSGTPQQCNEALYIPCDGTLSTNDCGTCTWSTTDTNDIWSQQVKDYAGSGILSEVDRPSRSAWPKRVYTGYSSELNLVTDNPSDGSKWDMSCHYQGTPGAPPLTSCSVSCVKDICRGNGDNNATCDTTKDVCDCTQSNQYVLTQSQTSCIYMPPPTNCQAINYNDAIVGTPQVDITWDACLCYEYGVKYRLTIDDDTFEAYWTSTRKFKPYAPLASSANVKVEAFMYDIVSEEN
eukprot:262550_1